jgi:hypothetical protein
MDGFNLNVVNLQLEKPLDEGQWSAGYKAELIFGPDAVGYNPSIFAGASDLSIKQAYIALRAPVGNGLDLKLGVWDTIIGYEVFNSHANPNYSRSFGWQLEPTQHTGLLASYQVNDWLSVSAGVANTWSAGINARSGRSVARPGANETHKTYMGSIAVTAPDTLGFLEGSMFYAGVVDGFAGNVGNDTTSLYAGAVVPTPNEALTFGLAFDYLFDNAFNGLTPAGTTAAGTGSNWAYALAGYASYQATEKLRLNARIDYTTGSDGTFYNANASSTGFVSDDQNEIIAPTLTVDYALWDNVLTRLEARWDHCMSGDKIYGSAADPDRNALTFALNLVYKF